MKSIEKIMIAAFLLFIVVAWAAPSEAWRGSQRGRGHHFGKGRHHRVSKPRIRHGYSGRKRHIKNHRSHFGHKRHYKYRHHGRHFGIYSGYGHGYKGRGRYYGYGHKRYYRYPYSYRYSCKVYKADPYYDDLYVKNCSDYKDKTASDDWISHEKSNTSD